MYLELDTPSLPVPRRYQSFEIGSCAVDEPPSVRANRLGPKENGTGYYHVATMQALGGPGRYLLTVNYTRVIGPFPAGASAGANLRGTW